MARSAPEFGVPMQTAHLNEHDANQGAQSSGEFLGMTGNSGWYLLGSSGATILMVIFLWGIFGVSLLLCLLLGTVLCGLSVAYVFALKNNRPQHYDTDFFESALVEAGIVSFRFGPRERPPANPFLQVVAEPMAAQRKTERTASREARPAARRQNGLSRAGVTANATSGDKRAKPERGRPDEEPVVARADYERVQEQLVTAEEMLEDALAERAES